MSLPALMSSLALAHSPGPTFSPGAVRHLAKGSRHLRLIRRACFLDREQRKEGRVVGLIDEGLVGAFLELGVEGVVQRLLRRVVGGRGRRGEERGLQRVRADFLDQRLVAQPVGADEAREETALDRLLDDGRARVPRIGYDDEGFRSALRQRRELRAIGVLLLLVLLGGDDLATGGLERLDEGRADADAVVVVHVGDGDLLDAFLEHDLGEHRALVVVGGHEAIEEIVVGQIRDRGRGRRRRHHDDAAGMATAFAAEIVVPDMSAPMMIGAPSTLTSLLAASTAAWALPVVSPNTGTALPSSRPPPSLTCFTARLTAFCSGGMKLAIGPVMSMSMPTLVSPALASAVEASKDGSRKRHDRFFHLVPPVVTMVWPDVIGRSLGPSRREVRS